MNPCVNGMACCALGSPALFFQFLHLPCLGGYQAVSLSYVSCEWKIPPKQHVSVLACQLHPTPPPAFACLPAWADLLNTHCHHLLPPHGRKEAFLCLPAATLPLLTPGCMGWRPLPALLPLPAHTFLPAVPYAVESFPERGKKRSSNFMALMPIRFQFFLCVCVPQCVCHVCVCVMYVCVCPWRRRKERHGSMCVCAVYVCMYLVSIIFLLHAGP